MPYGGNARCNGDQLPELVQLLERVRQAMSGVIQALWPSVSLPEGLGELAEKLQGARRRLRLWKISACRQGAREAWAMVKTRYTKAHKPHGRGRTYRARWEGDPCELSVRPNRIGHKVFPTGKLDSLLNGIEEEYNQSV